MTTTKTTDKINAKIKNKKDIGNFPDNSEDDIVKEITKLSEFKTFAKNPFIANLIIPKKNKVVKISTNVLPLVDTNTGELSEMAFIGIREKVDKEQFVKIFKNSIQEMFSLSIQGIRVFGYFLSATQISTDLVVFSYKSCMEYTHYKSKNSINLGLTELMNNGFIAKSEIPNMYFLNPSIFFNGDRMMLVKEYVKEGTVTAKRLFDEPTNQEILDFIPKNEEIQDNN